MSQAVVGIFRFRHGKMTCFRFRIRVRITDTDRSNVGTVAIFRIAFRIRIHKNIQIGWNFSVIISQ